MVFIWRGSGITVPIFLFLSGWITSFWFDGDDTKLGNPDFMSWTLLWAGIVLTLQGLAVLGNNMPDEETGETPAKSYHNFFWIPIWIWGVGFIALSIWMFISPSEAKSSSAENTEYVEDTDENISEFETERPVHFYNSTEDSIHIVIQKIDGSFDYFDFYLGSEENTFARIDVKDYIIHMDDASGKITIPGNKSSSEFVYEEPWLVLGDGVDLVLVDVTKACRDDINETELRAIDWLDQFLERYDGMKLIEPYLKFGSKETLTIIQPKVTLPLSHEKNEKVYALIPIATNTEVDEDFLDDAIVELCF